MSEFDDPEEPGAYASEQWWLATVGNLLVWARLRVRESGVAEILDCDGRTDTYDCEDTAHAALLDADFRAFDGIARDDANAMGFDLDSIEPPRVEDDDEDALHVAMSQRLPPMQ